MIMFGKLDPGQRATNEQKCAHKNDNNVRCGTKCATHAQFKRNMLSKSSL